MVFFLLESSQKCLLLNMGKESPFQIGLQRIRRQITLIFSRPNYVKFYLAWSLWERFYSEMQKKGIWEPHIFGILGALKFGIMGVHHLHFVLDFIGFDTSQLMWTFWLLFVFFWYALCHSGTFCYLSYLHSSWLHSSRSIVITSKTCILC